MTPHFEKLSRRLKMFWISSMQSNKEVELLPNSDFLISISQQPNAVDLIYLKLWVLWNQII